MCLNAIFFQGAMMCSSCARLARKSSSRSWPWWEWPPNPCTSADCRRPCKNGSTILVSGAKFRTFLLRTSARPAALTECTSENLPFQTPAFIFNAISLGSPLGELFYSTNSQYGKFVYKTKNPLDGACIAKGAK